MVNFGPNAMKAWSREQSGYSVITECKNWTGITSWNHHHLPLSTEEEAIQTAVSQSRNLSSRCEKDSVTLMQDAPVTRQAGWAFLWSCLWCGVGVR